MRTILVIGVVMCHLQFVFADGSDPALDIKAKHKLIKEEFANVDVDAAIEIAETDKKDSKLLESIENSEELLAGQDVGGDGDILNMDPVFLEA